MFKIMINRRARTFRALLAFVSVLLAATTLTGCFLRPLMPVPAETEVPAGTEPPQTDAPDTAVPGTDAPDTEAPDTDGPFTGAPDTDLPDTEAPDTGSPDTEVPGTEAPEPSATTAVSPYPTDGNTQLPEVTPEPTPLVDPQTPPPIVSQSGAYTLYEQHGIIRIDDRAFEVSYYVKGVAEQYAQLLERTAKELGPDTTVYSLIIPTSYGIMVPDDMRGKIPGYVDMRGSIELYFSMLENVRPVRCFDQLMLHRNEYLYFRTDHHWNGDGAYYGYEAFCLEKGFVPFTRSERQRATFGGFLGTFYTATNDPQLLPEDTVIAYYPYSKNATMICYDENGLGQAWPIVSNVERYRPQAKYSTFAGSDHPITVFNNPDVKGGSVLIIIKDSFGNALLPYLVDHYSTIYEIDYRYWKGELISFAQNVGATDIVFANCFTLLNSRITVGKLSKLIK